MPTSRRPATARAPASRAAAKRAPAQRPPAKRTPAKRAAAKKAPAKKAPAKKAPAKKAPAKKAPAKTTPKPSSRRPASKPKRTGPPPRWRRLVSGDRPLLVVMFAVVAIFVAMLLAPLQSFTSASERVDELEARKSELTAAVDELESRRSHLMDPEEVELLAREELGMVRPGEIPYVVTGPNGDVEKLPRLRPSTAAEPKSWWQRVTAAFSRLLDRSKAK